MTTPRIEEMVEEFEHKIMSVDELGHQAHIGDAYNAIQWLRQALTEAHQAGKKEGIDEAVKIMESMKEDGETPFGHQELHETELAYNQALDDTIKALTNATRRTQNNYQQRNRGEELLEQRRMVLEKILNVGGNAANMEIEMSFWQPQLDKIDELIAKTELRDNY